MRWLATSEPLGIVLSWMALLPRRGLADWDPPRGAEALLGILVGGVLFGAVRRSELWGDLNTVRHASLVALLGVVGMCVAGAGLLLGLAALAKRPAQLAVLLVGHLAGAVVLARGVRRVARPAGAVALSVLAGASVIALASH